MTPHPLPTPAHARPLPRHPRASVYIAVLAVSILVLVLGVGGVAVSRALARAGSESRDLSSARWAAGSGIEVTRYLIESNSSWRSQHANGAWLSNVPLGGALFSVTVTNPNGALDRSPYDPIDVASTASVNNCSHTAAVTLDAVTQYYTCLDVPLSSTGSMTFTVANLFGNGGTISSNQSITALLSSINADVEAVGLVSGTTYNGTNTILATPRTFPGADAFDYYTTHGTSIPFSSLPTGGSGRQITRVLLSPTSNPISGTTNAEGIYVIDCSGGALTITSCRIVGTLVILNPGASFAVSGSVTWEAAVSNYPCLMVDGAAALKTSSSTLSESSGTNTNFNPVGTPYPYDAGNADSDTSDSYPSVIDGLVYVAGNLSISGTVNTDVLVVRGTVSAGGSTYLNYTSAYKRSPPPGFATVTMTPRSGTWRQTVP